ncbi:hypothetical protein B1R38_27895 [Bacillus cereus]|uniref:tetratricopeptide repeat protein n=1 Tax=Bacillus cereus TaxID=1396 RepID=UPI000D671373|nr:tetratricopeptide repeat protein [Bacillus cereus]PWE70099.1 hypothetical protein B1R38_27895 [Bacillus cereus]
MINKKKPSTIDIYFNKNNLAFENLVPLTNYLLPGIINHKPEFMFENLEHSRYIFPNIQKFIKEPQLSITSATNFENRIRYYHQSKIKHTFNALIDIFIEQIENSIINEEHIINLYNCKDMLRTDEMFFSIFISRLENKNLKVQIYLDEKIPSLTQSNLVKELKSSNLQPLNTEFWDKKNREDLFKRSMTLALYDDAIKIGGEIFNSLEDSEKKYKLANKLGVAHVLNDQFSEGEKYYNYTIENSSNPKLIIGSLYGLSMLYMRHFPKEKRDINKAEYYLKKAEKIIIENENELGEHFTYSKVFNRNGYSLILFQKGEIELAHKYCDEGAKLLLEKYGDKKHILHRSVLIYNCTLTSTALKKYEQALNYFDYLLNLDPYYPDYWIQRADLHNKLGNIKNAIDDYSKAIKLNPFAEGMYFSRALLYEKSGKLKEASQDYQRAIDLNPKHTESILNYGVLLMNQQKLKEALDLFNKLLSLNIENKHEVYNNIGLIYLELKDYEKSIEKFNKSLLIKPDYSTSYANKAIVYFELKQMKESLYCLNKAINYENNNEEYIFNRAFLLNEIKEFDKCINDLNKLLNINPLNEEAKNLLQQVKTSLKNYSNPITI